MVPVFVMEPSFDLSMKVDPWNLSFFQLILVISVFFGVKVKLQGKVASPPTVPRTSPKTHKVYVCPDEILHLFSVS